jgi:hypothetical protein
MERTYQRRERERKRVYVCWKWTKDARCCALRHAECERSAADSLADTAYVLAFSIIMYVTVYISEDTSFFFSFFGFVDK